MPQDHSSCILMFLPILFTCFFLLSCQILYNHLHARSLLAINTAKIHKAFLFNEKRRTVCKTTYSVDLCVLRLFEQWFRKTLQIRIETVKTIYSQIYIALHITISWEGLENWTKHESNNFDQYSPLNVLSLVQNRFCSPPSWSWRHHPICCQVNNLFGRDRICKIPSTWQ